MSTMKNVRLLRLVVVLGVVILVATASFKLLTGKSSDSSSGVAAKKRDFGANKMQGSDEQQQRRSAQQSHGTHRLSQFQQQQQQQQQQQRQQVGEGLQRSQASRQPDFSSGNQQRRNWTFHRFPIGGHDHHHHHGSNDISGGPEAQLGVDRVFRRRQRQNATRGIPSSPSDGKEDRKLRGFGGLGSRERGVEVEREGLERRRRPGSQRNMTGAVGVRSLDQKDNVPPRSAAAESGTSGESQHSLRRRVTAPQGFPAGKVFRPAFGSWNIRKHRTNGSNSELKWNASGHSDVTGGSSFRPFATRLSAAERKTLLRTFKQLVSAFDAAKVSYWMDSATLLGSYRHHGLIPWDDDIDVLLRGADRPQAAAALKALSADYGMHVDRVENGTVVGWRFFPLQDSQPVDGAAYRFPLVDVLFYEENATHVWSQVVNWWPHMIWPKAGNVLPLTRRPFDGIQAPSPCNAAAYLAREFGPKFNEQCVSPRSSHRTSKPVGMRRVTVACQKLASMVGGGVDVPLVSRAKDQATGKITETLMLRNVALSTVTLDPDCQ